MLSYNAISGKSIENPMNRLHVKIVTTTKQKLKGSFRPTFNPKTAEGVSLTLPPEVFRKMYLLKRG